MIVYVEYVSLPETVFVYLYLCVCEFVSLPEAVFVCIYICLFVNL